MSKKKYSYIKEEPIGILGPGPYGKFGKKEGFIPRNAEDIKVVQVDPEGAKANQEYFLSWVNQNGGTPIMFATGRLGLKAEMEDGTVKYWGLGQDGEVRRYKKYSDGGYYVEDRQRKLERSFGISDEMWARKDNKIDLIHAIMFFVLICLPLAAIGASAALVLRHFFGQAY